MTNDLIYDGTEDFEEKINEFVNGIKALRASGLVLYDFTIEDFGSIDANPETGGLIKIPWLFVSANFGTSHNCIALVIGFEDEKQAKIFEQKVKERL